jgi:intracellular sulfur oxidation DsrE/DsrF family protein
VNEIKIVLHFDSNDQQKFKTLISSLYDIIDSLKDSEKDINVVVNDVGVMQFLKGNFDKYNLETLKEVMGSDVKIWICSVSLRKYGLSFNDLVDGLLLASSGMLKLMEFIKNGYVYLKI